MALLQVADKTVDKIVYRIGHRRLNFVGQVSVSWFQEMLSNSTLEFLLLVS